MLMRPYFIVYNENEGTDNTARGYLFLDSICCVEELPLPDGKKEYNVRTLASNHVKLMGMNAERFAATWDAYLKECSGEGEMKQSENPIITDKIFKEGFDAGVQDAIEIIRSDFHIALDKLYQRHCAKD